MSIYYKSQTGLGIIYSNKIKDFIKAVLSVAERTGSHFTEANLHLKFDFTEGGFPTPRCIPGHLEGHPALVHPPAPLLYLLGALSCG